MSTTVSIAPLVSKLKALFADGIQASDFARAAVILAAETELIGKVAGLTGAQKLDVVKEALLEASDHSAEVQTFCDTALPLVLQGAVLASKMGVSLKGKKSIFASCLGTCT